MLGAAGFLDSFVQDELLCRCLNEDAFGQPIANEENDVPLYDQYNRGLALCEQGLDRTNLALEGNQKRPGLTGYIPSMEDAVGMGALPQPKTLVLDLGGAPTKEMMEQSKKRRGLSR
tara:strand:- start:251 stop:601 length:351 start_codon:yes stop_codon:yes gene_type:complete